MSALKKNIIQDRSFAFALSIISLYQMLLAKREYVISKQLLRCGTSIGANVEEAIAGQSRKDFLHKISISLKEARETRYWLRLLDKSELTDIDLKIYLRESLELINILSAIVKTTKS